MKTLFNFLIFIIYCQVTFSQKLQIGNDSVSFNLRPSKQSNGDINGFSFEFSNFSKQQIFTGATQKNDVSCYVYKVGNTLLVLCGGMAPALNDYVPNYIQLYRLTIDDTLRFKGNVYQQYKGKTVIKKLDYAKMRKIFIIDYIAIPSNKLLNVTDYPYSDFLKNKSRLTLEINPD